MLVILVLKNAVECTSQRLKWTSGARVMVKVEVKVKVKVEVKARGISNAFNMLDMRDRILTGSDASQIIFGLHVQL